jgi:hypothetical protein
MNISPQSPSSVGRRQSDDDDVVQRMAVRPRQTPVRGLGTGAIAAPMAASFREEKLALRSGDQMVTVEPDGSLPTSDGRERK